MIGSQDVIIALVIGLVLFGSKKLPELARGLGQSLKEFKKATSDVTSEIQSAMDETPPPPPPKRLPANGTQPESQPTVSQSSPGTKPTMSISPTCADSTT